MKFTVSLIYGSVRISRKGIRVAIFLERKLKERNVKVHFIDPKEYQLPLLDKMYKEYRKGQAPQELEELAEKFRNSDGFLIVTGEYNHGIPPAMKNTLDYFQTEYFFKPSAIACYSSGSFGGVRAASQMRSVTGELGMPSISSIQPFPNIAKNFDESGNPQDERIEKSTRRFIDEFLWYMEAFKTQRDKGTPY